MDEHLGDQASTVTGSGGSGAYAGGDVVDDNHDVGGTDGAAAAVDVCDQAEAETSNGNTGSAVGDIPRSITRRRKPSVYLGFEDGDGDEGTRL
jgi:hypothetical protein